MTRPDVLCNADNGQWANVSSVVYMYIWCTYILLSSLHNLEWAAQIVHGQRNDVPSKFMVYNSHVCTGCVSKNLTFRMLTVKKIQKTGLKLINNAF